MKYKWSIDEVQIKYRLSVDELQIKYKWRLGEVYKLPIEEVRMK